MSFSKYTGYNYFSHKYNCSLYNKQEVQGAIDGRVKKVAILCPEQTLIFRDMGEKGKSLALVWTICHLQGLKAMSHRL